jgi:transcriptional regulator with XRE-family HTH domain
MANKPWDKDREKLRTLLKKLRTEEASYTQMELSKALGRPQSYVSKYEIGERRLDYIEVKEICDALDVPMQKFNELFEKK